MAQKKSLTFFKKDQGLFFLSEIYGIKRLV